MPGWLSWLSGRLQLRSWSHSSWVQAPCQALCWQLGAWSLLPILCLPLSLSLPLPCSHSVPLSLKSKYIHTYIHTRLLQNALENPKLFWICPCYPSFGQIIETWLGCKRNIKCWALSVAIPGRADGLCQLKGTSFLLLSFLSLFLSSLLMRHGKYMQCVVLNRILLLWRTSMVRTIGKTWRRSEALTLVINQRELPDVGGCII